MALTFPSTKVSDIRKSFAGLLKTKDFTVNGNKTGSTTIEIIGAKFIADEPTIFGEINLEYIKREEEWYLSMSRNVNDIPGGPPKIWQMVATPDGRINSNYGWCIFSEENNYQFSNCVETLVNDPSSRRAIMIYTRPSIQVEYNTDGMSDFICTNTVQYFIRNNQLITLVSMRSNDAWAGYRNDFAWQKHVSEMLLIALKSRCLGDLTLGPIIWDAASLHIYERQFHLVEHYIETGEHVLPARATCKP
jgi:thymidylate synthase